MKTILSCLFLVIFSCNSSNAEKNEKLEGKYTIVKIKNQENKDKQLNIVFETNTYKISGFSGCNNFFGIYKNENSSIELSEIAVSSMMCIDNEIMDTEDKYLSSLELITNYKVKDNTVEFYDKDQNLVLAAKKNEEQ